ncbi:MAG: PaaI family thioesterase [Polyangiaceae bacterium]
MTQSASPPPELRAIALAAVAGDAAALTAYLATFREGRQLRGLHMGATLGVETLDVAVNRVTMRMPWRPELRRGGDIFHGGAIMALADHVAGCVFHTDPRTAAANETGLTTDFSVSFLHALPPGEALVACGSVLRRGRNVTFIQVDVRGEASESAVAACRATYLTTSREKLKKRG